MRAFQIHKGRQNAADLVGSIADPSNIDATSTTRLFTAWFQQDFGKAGSIRVGQLAADDEFLTSTTAGGLINGTFGWATMVASNLPSGGAAYPLATPGARLQINLDGKLFASWRRVRRRSRRQALLRRQSGRQSADLQQARHHVQLLTAARSGSAKRNIRSIRKRTRPVWRPPTRSAPGITPATNSPTSVSAMTAPAISCRSRPIRRCRSITATIGASTASSTRCCGEITEEASACSCARALRPSDRNLVSRYIDGGIGFKGLFPGRPDDTLTLGAAHSKISKDAAALDQRYPGAQRPALPDPQCRDRVRGELHHAARAVVDAAAGRAIYPCGRAAMCPIPMTHRKPSATPSSSARADDQFLITSHFRHGG